MDNIKQMITSIDLDSLLKLFDLQIAIGVLLFFIVFRKVFSKALIKLYYKIIKHDKNPKESEMYKSLNLFFILLGIYCMINILPTSKQILYNLNNDFEVQYQYHIF